MLVSVIIPTHDRAATLARAVDSALAQTHTPLEVIVVDDGSTDGTAALLASYGSRIHVVCQTNAGPSAARNRGAAAAQGGILAFLDSDDRWLPEKIERQAALMDRGGTRMACCVCNARVDDHLGTRKPTSFDSANLAPPFAEGVWTNPQEVLSSRFLLFNQVAAIRRDAFDACGGFNPRLDLLEDYDLSLRLSTLGPWGVIRDPLTVKYNDTAGIGVRCMNDHESHIRARTAVIRQLLGSGMCDTLAQRSAANLRRELALLDDEAQAIHLTRRGGLAAAAGRLLAWRTRCRRAWMRRSSAWPTFAGKPL